MGNREDLKIIITIDGNCTTAKLWKTGRYKSIACGKAHCAPGDKFDLQTGAMLALARMFGDEVEFIPEEPLKEIEKEAEADGYNLCRYGYPKRSGYYKTICEDGDFRMTLPWSSKHRTFGAHDEWTSEDAHGGVEAWMTPGFDPVIAWKETE